jgi:hypothetical protein
VFLLIVFLMFITVAWHWLQTRDLRRLSGPDRAYFLIAGVLALTLGMLVAVRYLAGYPYPKDRTAIYLVVLLTLAWMLLVEKLWIEKPLERTQMHRVWSVLAAAPVLLAIVLFLRGFTTSYYYEWRFDAGTKRIFQLLQQQHQQFSSAKPLRLGVDWRLNFSFNFYRSMYRADWLKRVTRDPREAGGFDYYVTYPQDEAALQKLRLRKIYQDPVSDQELLVREDSAALASQPRVSEETGAKRRR